MLEKQKNRLIRIGITLTVLIIATPVILQILLEKMMGPGSSVSGGKLNGILLPINFILASIALQNLLISLKLSPTKKD